MKMEERMEGHVVTEVYVRCDKCGKHEDDQTCDEFGFASELVGEGWTVTRSDRVLCPDCRPASRRRRAP